MIFLNTLYPHQPWRKKSRPSLSSFPWHVSARKTANVAQRSAREKKNPQINNHPLSVKKRISGVRSLCADEKSLASCRTTLGWYRRARRRRGRSRCHGSGRDQCLSSIRRWRGSTPLILQAPSRRDFWGGNPANQLWYFILLLRTYLKCWAVLESSQMQKFSKNHFIHFFLFQMCISFQN